MMWQSLIKLRDLPDDTKFYCGHEYTDANINFALTIEPDNAALKARADEVKRSAPRASRRFRRPSATRSGESVPARRRAGGREPARS